MRTVLYTESEGEAGYLGAEYHMMDPLDNEQH